MFSVSNESIVSTEDQTLPAPFGSYEGPPHEACFLELETASLRDFRQPEGHNIRTVVRTRRV